ncbi:MAG: hypothetical protein IKU29_04435 [Parabacteroides sp.]|nr:hypothetical protein [Parabacteroides sp.]
MKIREILEAVKLAAGTNEKKSIIDQNLNDVIKNIFADTYDTSVKYNIKSIPESTRSGLLTIDNDYDMFRAVLGKLSRREVTGNDAVKYVLNWIESYVEEDQVWLRKIIDRNLKIGVSLSNFSDICQVVDEFTVALAENLDKVKGVDPLDGTYFASQKLDGTRCICFVDIDDELEIDITFKSRQGKEFTTLDNLKPHIKQLFMMFGSGSWVLDGECCIMIDGKESFKAIMKEIKRKDHTIEHPCYKVFDLLTREEFEERESDRIFSERLKWLVSNWYESDVDNTYVDVLEQERICDQETFDKWSNKVKEYGWEGFMLRKDVPYKGGRSKDLLKVKKFQDAEYKVVDVETGVMTYKKEGGGSVEFTGITALGIMHKGNRVAVGIGLSREQRIKWLENPQLIIGKTITVQYFEETSNKNGKYSLRFPALKYVYEEERDC